MSERSKRACLTSVVYRNESGPKTVVKQEFVWGKEELQQERKMQLTSSMLVTDLANKLDKQEDKREVFDCCFLRLRVWNLKRVHARSMPRNTSWDSRTWNTWKELESEEENMVKSNRSYSLGTLIEKGKSVIPYTDGLLIMAQCNKLHYQEMLGS